ncbi:acyl-CoA dehydrogenase family protein [Iodidimonas sp. SYSU 1G8]|uniref:acyl-CoA dehydrogenase family protein n=1 Tax=Iodidimonas sp. SYSU 1G8 TaxID=3133967 RepID=UPI0031FF3487
MNFEDSPEEAAFRADARAWLAENAAPYKKPLPENLTEAQAVAMAKEWQAKKAAAGYAAITWPKEVGGMGGTPMQRVIFEQEEAQYNLPPNVFAIGLGMCMPTMLAFATPEQQKRHVPKALSGEEIWCQLFSEPAGGSDLAALRTKAEKDGDDWVVNGQKIWTSGAHLSDWGILVTRTDPTKPKHEGLTFFFLNMKSPGVEVKPIKQASGARGFNEVYFTDVRIPDSQRLGAVGDGWKVSLTTLMNERLSISENSQRGINFDMLMKLAGSVDGANGPAIRDKAVREQLADWYAKYMGLRNGRYRTMTALSQGARPGPEASINKAVFASMLQDMASFGLDLLDTAGVATDPHLEGFRRQFADAYMGAPGLRIAGGTDEILRNIIAERVLGLPPDIRADKGIPFNKVPTSAN